MCGVVLFPPLECGAGTHMGYPGRKRMVVSIIFSLLRMLSSGYIPQRTLPTLWDHRNVSTKVDIATFSLITMGCGSLVVHHTSLVCSYFEMLLFY